MNDQRVGFSYQTTPSKSVSSVVTASRSPSPSRSTSSTLSNFTCAGARRHGSPPPAGAPRPDAAHYTLES